jgi:choline dehydrogenase-like flavoprotein
MSDQASDQLVVDYIVVGGGSAGCAVASRLSEDAHVSVAVLEMGGDGDKFLIRTPAAIVLMAPTGIHSQPFDTVAQAGLNNRLGYQPRGKVMGGSSAVNAMAYIRGHQSDYDHWAALGNSGWSWDEVLPYFKKSEHNNTFNNEWHGQGGPLQVSECQSDSPLRQVWLEAAKQAGYPVTDDFNGPQQEGIGLFQLTQKNGERWSTYRGFLQPHIGKRANLRIETGALTQRVLFDGKVAVGVEYKQGGVTKKLMARKEVILSAGAFQSPQLLMLSGVGDADELKKHGIPVVHHLPGVGKNLQDHPDFVFCYKSKSQDTFGLSLGGAVRLLREMSRYKNERRGMITTNFAEGGGFLKTDAALAAPDIQLHLVTAIVDDHARTLHMGHGFSCHVCVLRPKSRGTVGIADRHAETAPVIDPNFFGHEDDVDVMLKGYKMTKTLMQTAAFAPWISKELYTADIKTDDEIRDILRKRTDSVYHPVGSCKMGTDEMAVVDPALKVHGISGLRVIDASIMPTLIGGNTNAPAIMIGEKGADLIRQAR